MRAEVFGQIRTSPSGDGTRCHGGDRAGPEKRSCVAKRVFTRGTQATSCPSGRLGFRAPEPHPISGNGAKNMAARSLASTDPLQASLTKKIASQGGARCTCIRWPCPMSMEKPRDCKSTLQAVSRQVHVHRTMPGPAYSAGLRSMARWANRQRLTINYQYNPCTKSLSS